MVSGKSKEQDGEKMEVRTEMILCSVSYTSLVWSTHSSTSFSAI